MKTITVQREKSNGNLKIKIEDEHGSRLVDEVSGDGPFWIGKRGKQVRLEIEGNIKEV